ncbi:uncharacterized protein LOC126720258 isoform X1 [Quercus robur]|uniref:uncharacterized protein LOC126720258 isoform X1 n=1 Tax=Quercus robur TaxID=38942 RepID=UPI002163B750|nr:uncharacterized protein LOC126720258 isoform X1 [Quercus robur]
MSGYVLGLRGFQPLHPIINISLSQGKGNGSSFSLLTNSNYVFSNSISKQLVLSLWSSTTITTTSSSCTPKLKTQATKSQAGSSSSWPQQQSQKQEEEEEEEEEEFQLVTAIRSQFNDILIVDSPNSRMLLLDATHNVHSILYKDQKWTGSYWDEFASLPAIVPKGPIAIFGLVTLWNNVDIFFEIIGGGTTARLMLDLWPSLQLEGWEIDEILIEKSREYLGLSDLEKHTVAGGILNVHIGDALSQSVNASGGFAGIVVDLFSGGKVLPQLQEVQTWLELNDRLMPNGRLMVNCGGIDEAADVIDGVVHPKNSSIDGTWVQNFTIKALSKAFPGKLSWKRKPNSEGENYLALTGPLPDLISWSAIVPDPLRTAVKQWKPCGTFS